MIKENVPVYALRVNNSDKVEGLIGCYVKAVHVKLVESAYYNKTRQYEGIGAHLFAFAVKLSKEAGYDGFVYFETKTNLIDYYRMKLGVKLSGYKNRMFIDIKEADKLYKEYYESKNDT